MNWFTEGWFFKPARRWQFWMPRSGFPGGAILGVIIGVVAGVLFQ